MSYSVEKADLNEHRCSLCDLWQRNFEVVPSERFSWMYDKNPIGEPVVFLLKHDQTKTFVGTISLLPHVLLVEGQHTTSYICGDMAVDPAHRALGPAITLLKTAIQFCEDNAPCVLLSIPNKKSSPVASRVGFQRLGTYFSMTQVLQTGRYIRQHIKPPVVADSLAFLADKALKIHYNFKSLSQTRGRQTALADHFDNSLNVLMQSRAEKLSLIGKRTIPFLQWRLRASPHGSNQTFVLENENTPSGYISYSVRNNRCEVEDFAFDGNAQNLKALLAAFTMLQMKNGVEAISISLAGQKTLIDLLVKAGFSIRGKEN